MKEMFVPELREHGEDCTRIAHASIHNSYQDVRAILTLSPKTHITCDREGEKCGCSPMAVTVTHAWDIPTDVEGSGDLTWHMGSRKEVMKQIEDQQRDGEGKKSGIEMIRYVPLPMWESNHTC